MADTLRDGPGGTGQLTICQIVRPVPDTAVGHFRVVRTGSASLNASRGLIRDICRGIPFYKLRDKQGRVKCKDEKNIEATS